MLNEHLSKEFSWKTRPLGTGVGNESRGLKETEKKNKDESSGAEERVEEPSKVPTKNGETTDLDHGRWGRGLGR